MIAVAQVRNDTPGRAHYLRGQAEGKSRMPSTTTASTALLARRVADRSMLNLRGAG